MLYREPFAAVKDQLIAAKFTDSTGSAYTMNTSVLVTEVDDNEEPPTRKFQDEWIDKLTNKLSRLQFVLTCLLLPVFKSYSETAVEFITGSMSFLITIVYVAVSLFKFVPIEQVTWESFTPKFIRARPSAQAIETKGKVLAIKQ